MGPYWHAVDTIGTSSAIDSTSAFGSPSKREVRTAVDLYRGRWAGNLIFSSGFVFAFEETQVMKALAVDSGVPASAIVLETRAANTHENVLFSRDLAEARQWKRILLVSSPYHMRRALLTWRKAAPSIEVVAAPVPASQFYTHGRGASLEQIRGIGQEYAAILMYWWRGWI